VSPRAGVDRCGKSRPPPGFDPRTIQPVASRYTDYATRPTGLFIDALLLCRNITSVCGNCSNPVRSYGVNISSPLALRPPSVPGSDTPQSVGRLWTSDPFVAEIST